jgi:hypothetical protein
MDQVRVYINNMKAKYIFWLSFTAIVLKLNAQTSKDYAVLLRAVITESPASIKLEWVNDPDCSGYQVFRKTKDAGSWGQALATLPNTAVSYTDAAVTAGQAYEYYVYRSYNIAKRFAHGYIHAGIRVLPQPYKGKLLLLIDHYYEQPLAAEINQLKQDLAADGWYVKPYIVSRDASVPSLKVIITGEMADAQDPAKGLYLLGHVPVPYSGKFKAEEGSIYPPDGHPDHGGAWPADLYYGVMNEAIWTDIEVNDSTPTRSQNKNVPGDGKFDISYIYPETVSVQIGRVDLTDMPAFGMSDTLLMKRYLDKAHMYKTGQTEVIRRGLVDDKFGALDGEAFAASGWRNFTAMFGDSVSQGAYIASTKKGNYQFTYGCGAGSFTSVSGVCNTGNFTDDSVSQVFTMLFGSYHGDWNSTNNVLRAPLASANGGLASVWSGRPHWHLHHMALGENIGYSARLTQSSYYDYNNGSPSGYFYNSSPTFIHIALMGDPSLRLHMNPTLQSVAAVPAPDSLSVEVSWPVYAGADGYLILKATSATGRFVTAADLPGSATTYTDLTPYYGYTTYMVRPYKLEYSASGSYYNLSLGTIDSAYSLNTTGIAYTKKRDRAEIAVFPNPANGAFTVSAADIRSKDARIEVMDITGKVLLNEPMRQGLKVVNAASLKPGAYMVKVISSAGEAVKKIIIQ